MTKKTEPATEKKKLRTVAISPEIHELVKKEAEKDRRTVGVTVTMLIEEGLALRS